MNKLSKQSTFTTKVGSREHLSAVEAQLLKSARELLDPEEPAKMTARSDAN